MIVRSYTGRSVQEALDKVRADLGANALIVETRPWHEPGLLGRKCGYEVVAAGDGPSGSDPATDHDDWRRRTRERAAREQRTTAGQADALEAARADRRRPVPLHDQTAGHGEGVSLELLAIRRQLARLAAGQGTPTGHLGDELASRLEDAELPHELVAELDDAVARAGERLASDKRELFCTRYLAHQIDCPGGLDWERNRHLLMVGPTGVGKTTTLAKLAGDLVLRQQRRIALVTIDTYRVGAADQLETYADLLDAPCTVARTPAQLAEALERHRDCDNVLIDTAGRSPADATRLHELRAFCRAAPGLSVMLAVAATCGRAEFASVVERFSILPVEHGVLTKLDEAQAPGRVIGCLRRHRLPINYLTTGQEVPTDFETAHADRLANAVLTRATADAA